MMIKIPLWIKKDEKFYDIGSDTFFSCLKIFWFVIYGESDGQRRSFHWIRSYKIRAGFAWAEIRWSIGKVGWL